MKFTTLAVALTVAGTAALGFTLQRESPVAASTITAAPQTGDLRGQAMPTEQLGQTLDTATPLSEALIEGIAADLAARYGANIDDPAIQVQLLNDRNTLIARHPQTGARLFDAALDIAFPRHASVIRERVAAMAQYRLWEDEMVLTLNNMELMEREGMLWGKRQALFGDAAQKIWKKEIETVQRSQRLVQGELQRLNKATSQSLDETLYQLQATVDANHSPLGLEALGQPALRSTLAGSFFRLDSVQQQLAAMPEDQRQQEIDRARQQLGYSAGEVAAMAEQDRQRNQRWQTGTAYMNERETLASQYSGAELEQRLSEVRAEYFGRNAVTIAREEAEGFYRYSRPRVYGRN